MAYALIQEGGSSAELYLHVWDTLEDAEQDRLECAEASYRTTEPVEVPGGMAWDVIDSLLDSLSTLS